MKINRSNRLLRGLLITAAVAPSLAFAQVDPSNPSNNILGDDVLLGNVIDDPTNADPLVLIVDPALQVDVQVTGQTLLNGTLTVQPLETTVITPGTPVAGSGVSTTIGGVNPAGTGGPSILNQTLIDTTQDSQEVTGGGGATIETNGNTTLSSDTSTTTTVTYGRRVTFETAQAGNIIQPLVGVAIPNTEIYYLTDSAGVVVPGAPTFSAAIEGSAALASAALDAYIAGLTPGDIFTLYPALGTEITAGGGGGNLTVEGNTTLVGGTEDLVTGDSVGGNLEVGGDTTLGDSVNDDTTVTGDLNVAGNTEVDSLTVTNDVAVGGNIQVDGQILDQNGDNLISLQANGVHIGPNSLITNYNAVTNQQELFAEDLLNNPIDIAITNGSNLVVDGGTTTTTLDVTGNTQLDGDLNVDGITTLDETTVDGTLDVTGDTDLDGNLNVDGTIATAGAGAVVVNDSLNVTGATDLDGTLNVDGAISTAGVGAVVINDSLNVTSNADVDGNLNVDGNAQIDGNTDIDGALTVDGNSTLGNAITDATLVNGTLNVTSNADVDGNLNVDGNTQIDGTLNVDGNTQLDGTLNVDGNTTLGNAITDATLINGTLNVTSNADVDGNLNVDGSAQIDGNTDIDGALTVDGNTTLGNAITDSTLVNGTLRTTSNADIDGNLNVDGTIATAGAGSVVVADNFNVTGNTDLDGTLNVDGVTTLSTANITNGNITNAEITTLNVNGNADVDGTLNVDGITTLSTANITTANVSTLNVSGNASVGGSLDMTSGQIRNLANGTIASDAVNLGQMQAADTSIRNDFESADRRLQSQVDSNRYQIDRNTRGIAMVAAMTNTTIQPGMKQAIDFNLAQFDDATGFGFGYGYRVNENLQINAAGASTTDFEESVVRLGLSYQW